MRLNLSCFSNPEVVIEVFSTSFTGIPQGFPGLRRPRAKYIFILLSCNWDGSVLCDCVTINSHQINSLFFPLLQPSAEDVLHCFFNQRDNSNEVNRRQVRRGLKIDSSFCVLVASFTFFSDFHPTGNSAVAPLCFSLVESRAHSHLLECTKASQGRGSLLNFSF